MQPYAGIADGCSEHVTQRYEMKRVYAREKTMIYIQVSIVDIYDNVSMHSSPNFPSSDQSISQSRMRFLGQLTEGAGAVDHLASVD